MNWNTCRDLRIFGTKKRLLDITTLLSTLRYHFIPFQLLPPPMDHLQKGTRWSCRKKGRRDTMHRLLVRAPQPLQAARESIFTPAPPISCGEGSASRHRPHLSCGDTPPLLLPDARTGGGARHHPIRHALLNSLLLLFGGLLPRRALKSTGTPDRQLSQRRIRPVGAVRGNLTARAAWFSSARATGGGTLGPVPDKRRDKPERSDLRRRGPDVRECTGLPLIHHFRIWDAPRKRRGRSNLPSRGFST